MADTKISALTAATTPLAGTEVLPIVQSGTTKKVAVSDLTAGRPVNASTVTTTGNAGIGASASAWFNTLKAAQIGTQGSVAFDSGNGNVLLGKNLYKSSSSDYTYIANDVATLILQGAGGFAFYTAPSGTAGNTMSLTQRAILDFSGNLTLDTGNLVIGTSGKGIDFSATPGTGTSELLSDYEEGTWTPVIARSGGGLSYTPSGSDVGYYTKVGRQVTVTCSFGGTWTGGSGDFEITGLPFTVGGSLYAHISTSIINNSAANTLGTCWPVTGATKLTSFDTFVSGNICSAGGVYFV